MASVVMKNGIGYSEASGARFIDESLVMGKVAAAKDMQPASPSPQTKPYNDSPALPWSPWGKNNLLGTEMAADIKKTGVLNGIIEGKMRFTMNQGILPAIVSYDKAAMPVVEKILYGTPINTFLRDNNMFFTAAGLAKDYIGFNRSIARLGLNRKGTEITQLRRADVSEARMSKKDGHGNIRNVWYSADWSKIRGEDQGDVFSEPLLDPHNPYQDLHDRIDGGDKKRWFSMMVSHPGWQEQYYPTPLWMTQVLWVKIAQAVPEMKAIMFENNIRVKYIVIIYQSFWTESFGDEWDGYTDEQRAAKRKQVFEDIDNFLVGSKNAYKSVFTTGYRDSEGRTYANIEIKPIDDTTVQGELLPDSAAANSEIAFSMLWNLAITGGTQKAGQYQGNEGGSNVRESSLMQVILHEVERQVIYSIMNVIARFNGWDVKYPGLDWIIPTTILTTTDTGGGTTVAMTGDKKTEKDTKEKEAA